MSAAAVSVESGSDNSLPVPDMPPVNASCVPGTVVEPDDAALPACGADAEAPPPGCAAAADDEVCERPSGSDANGQRGSA